MEGLDGTEGVDVNALAASKTILVDEPATPSSTAFDGHFTENKGQLEDGAGRYYALGHPISVAFGLRWMAYMVEDPDDPSNKALVRVEFVGASGIPPVGREPLEHRYHYFIGNDPDEWVSDVGNYRNILYRDLWQGVDLLFYFSDGKLKYDLIVDGGVSPDVIGFMYEGADGLSIDGPTGDLVVGTVAATFRDEAPTAFQDTPAGRVDVACRFRLLSDDTIRFDVGGYDDSRPLVIDPGLVFSTYFGGWKNDDISEVTVGEDGSIYLAGDTSSSDFPTTPGAYRENGSTYQDIVVTKMDPMGTRILWSTYIGGMEARVGSDEGASDICVDEQGFVYVTGYTGSEDFPSTSGALQTESISEKDMYDAFALKLANDGSSLEFSTFISGNLSDSGVGIRVDDEGAVIIAGTTTSPSFLNLSRNVSYPDTNDDPYNETDTDIFIVRLDGEGKMLLDHTFIGGSMKDGLGSFEMDDEGNICIGGITYSQDFPTTSGVYGIEHSGMRDAFVMKIGPELDEVIWSTFLGGSGNELGSCMDLDPDGSIWVGFMSISSDFPTTPGAINEEPLSGHDFILTKVSSDGSEILISTYLGGNDYDTLFKIKVDEVGHIYMCGFTVSADLPTTAMALQRDRGVWQEGFLYVLDNNASEVLYCSYIGGNSWDGIKDMAFINPLDVVLVGYTSGTGFPTTEDALYPDSISRDDSFVMRLQPDTRGPPSAPMDIVASPGDGQIDLEWGPPEDDGGLPVTGYVIHRGTDIDNMIQLALVGDITGYTDDTAENDVMYYYAVAAINDAGYGGYARSDGVVPRAPPTPPTVPGIASLEPPVVTKRAVILAWMAPADDGGSPLTGYIIYRGLGEEELDLVAKVGPDILNWTDSDVRQGKTYWYSLAPENDVGEGASTPPIEVDVPKQEEESPAFLSWFVIIAMMLSWMSWMRRRQ